MIGNNGMKDYQSMLTNVLIVEIYLSFISFIFFLDDSPASARNNTMIKSLCMLSQLFF